MTMATFGITFHGRGGQGVVTAAELASVAAFYDGREAQAIPSFGSERMGAPVAAYCRVGDAPIRVREPIADPDAVVVVDATLLHSIDVTAGLRPGGLLLVNSERPPEALGLDAGAHRWRVVTVNATDIARRRLGRPLPNVCMLGAVAAATGVISLGSLERAVVERFSAAIAAGNLAAVAEGYRTLTETVTEQDLAVEVVDA